MNPKILSLFLTWTQMDPLERAEFHMAVGSYNDLPGPEREQILRRIHDLAGSIDLGPLKSPCPRCGR